ncbi:MAG: dephospho-CoA kinase [Phycisphaerales bacterium]|nr:dephospho-CoA kinase [Phycisphaerales bacterium]
MTASIPIIGITGGIGSGKSFVSNLFTSFDCVVANADDNTKVVLNRPETQTTLTEWWGDEVIAEDGQTNRSFIASIVFNDEDARKQLESLIHPAVRELQNEQFALASEDTRALVIDAPLLLETDLHTLCDAVVFVQASDEIRLARVQETRVWDENELRRREEAQMPLDKKADSADYVIINESDQSSVMTQIKQILDDIKRTTS